MIALDRRLRAHLAQPATKTDVVLGAAAIMVFVFLLTAFGGNGR